MENDLQQALMAWQGNNIPPGREDALLQRLREDETFRAAFAEAVWTLSLSRVAQAPEPRWLALQEELGLGISAPQPSKEAFESGIMRQVRLEPLRFVAAWWQWLAMGAVAACFVLSGVLTLRPSLRHVSPLNPESGVVAVVAGSQNAVWKSHALATGSALGAEHVQLSSGRASLLFVNGVKLDMEGPADVELRSPDRVICTAGRLRTRVPHNATGFCVETPKGAVTDLGTEAGLYVTSNGETAVTVFEGQVEASLQIPDQQGVRTTLLNTNDTVQLVPKTGEIRSGSNERFIDAAPSELPPLLIPASYADVIRAARPIDYWQLSRVEGDTTPNEIAGAPPLLLAGGAQITHVERDRGYARLQGRNSPGALYLENPWPKPADQYAVEMWLCGDSLEQVALFALTEFNGRSKHIALVEAGSRRPGHAAEAGVLRFLTRWPAGARGGMNVYSHAIAFPFQWHHLVAQQSGGQMELYLDGTLLGTAHADAVPGAMPCALQFGCLAYRPGDPALKLQRPFSGRMAEIALYDRLLSPTEIRQHAQLKAAGGP